ncbi:MAG: helix-turn-helix domain-containing protein [Ruminiclostridium sp.]|nr:helix-turn-helix domain-containing protein [Ruminiclostridium sp.]
MLTNNATKSRGNCFTVPNVIYNLDLSMGALAVYGFLLRLEDRHPGRNQYTCHPSYATIGSAIKRSTRSVAKYVQELVEAGLILTEPTSVTTKDGQKWNGNLRYTIQPIQYAVDLYNERQIAKLDAGVQKKRKVMNAAAKKRERKQISHAEYIAARSVHEPEELPV